MDKIDKLLTLKVKNNKTPSVQYFFFDSNSNLKSFQMGFADIANQKRVNTVTTYNAFSVTKTFTSLAVLQLFEKKLIALNKPIVQYLPEFPYGSGVSIKHLLNHTAGIPNPIPLSWIHLESEHSSFNRDDYFEPILKKNSRVKSKPNEKFVYSNLGYILLGQLIEKVTGSRFEEYIVENIIQKLSLKPDDMSFTISNIENHAKGYHKKMSFSNLLLGFFMNKKTFFRKSEGKWNTFKNFYVNGAPYGGLIGKPTAFVKYIQELLKGDNRLISEEYKKLLFQENQNNKGKNTGMCLGWFTGDLNGNKYFAHAGGGGGYYCEIRIYPDLNKGSVIFFNRSGMSDERYLDKLDIELI